MSKAEYFFSSPTGDVELYMPYWYTDKSPSIDFYNADGTGNYWDILFDVDYVDSDDSLRIQINEEDVLVLNTDKTVEFSGNIVLESGATIDNSSAGTIDVGSADVETTGDVQATEFRMGTDAVIKFNSVTNSIDFIIN
jgi:hypothetical protein